MWKNSIVGEEISLIFKVWKLHKLLFSFVRQPLGHGKHALLPKWRALFAKTHETVVFWVYIWIQKMKSWGPWTRLTLNLSLPPKRIFSCSKVVRHFNTSVFVARLHERNYRECNRDSFAQWKSQCSTERGGLFTRIANVSGFYFYTIDWISFEFLIIYLITFLFLSLVGTLPVGVTKGLVQSQVTTRLRNAWTHKSNNSHVWNFQCGIRKNTLSACFS